MPTFMPRSAKRRNRVHGFLSRKRKGTGVVASRRQKGRKRLALV